MAEIPLESERIDNLLLGCRMYIILLGKPDGEWIQYLDANKRVLPDTVNYTYIRQITYDKGVILGTVKYFYNNRKLYFETNMSSVDPDVISDGKVYYFFDNGKLMQEEQYTGGYLEGMATYFEKTEV